MLRVRPLYHSNRKLHVAYLYRFAQQNPNQSESETVGVGGPTRQFCNLALA